MNKFLILLAAGTATILIGGVFFVSKGEKPAPPPTTYEYFWGDGCPHCAEVAKFFDSWDGDEKLQIDKKEVWNNTKNQSLMNQRAKACNIAPTEMGVPLLVTPEGKCIGGDGPIIDFFKNYIHL